MNDGQKALIDDQSMDGLIGMYVKMRDRIKAQDDEHKEKMKPAKELLEYMNNRLLEKLNEVGGDSIKTGEGTAYRTEKRSASIEDATAFRDFVIANELWEMADWRANVTAVEDFREEHQSLPPGVKFNSVFLVGVRRPGEK